MDARGFGVCKLLVKSRIGRGKNMNKKPPLLHGAICSQFVPRLCAACSPFEYLLEHVVVAVDVVVLLSQGCDGATRMEDCRMVAVAERVADVRDRKSTRLNSSHRC